MNPFWIFPFIGVCIAIFFFWMWMDSVNQKLSESVEILAKIHNMMATEINNRAQRQDKIHDHVQS